MAGDGVAPQPRPGAARRRRTRPPAALQRRWVLPLLIVISALGFLAASVSFALQSRGAMGRPRISRLSGAVQLPERGLDLTRLRAMAVVRAQAGGSFRLSWDDGSLVDIGGGTVLIQREPRSIAVEGGDLGALVPPASPELTIRIPGASLVMSGCQCSAHLASSASQVQVVHGKVRLHGDDGRDTTLTAGQSLMVAPSGTPMPAGASPATVPSGLPATASVPAPSR